MPSWPDVVPGGEIEHHALLENQLRHMVNSVNGFMGGIQRATSGGVVRVQIWNAGTEAFVAGQPVAFDSTKELCGDALPAIPVSDPEKPWGVCVNRLEPLAMGDCIVAGPAKVTLAGGSGDYAKPSGTGFVCGNEGNALVLYRGTSSVILLGGTGGGGGDEYNGYFKIVDMSETDEETGQKIFKIGVVDGRTYNSETGTSGDSIAYINGTNVSISAFTSEVTSGKTTFVQLEYIYATGATAIKLSENALLPSDDSMFHVLIGRVNFNSGAMSIEQVHTSGIITINTTYRGGFKLAVTPTEGENGRAYACKMFGGYVDALRTSVSDMVISWTGGVYFNVLYTVETQSYSFTVTSSAASQSDAVRSVSIFIGRFDGTQTTQYFTGGSITLAGNYVL